MIRFLFNSIWKTFLLFFTIHVVTHWSEIQQIISHIQVTPTEEVNYRQVSGRLLLFVIDGATTSANGVFEIAKFLVFVAERARIFLYTQTFYNM